MHCIRMKRQMNMKNFYGWVLATGVVMSMAACGNRQDKQQQIQSVKVEQVMPNSEKSVLQFPGRVMAAQHVDLAFRVSGTLQQIYVKEGQHVKAGQLIAQLDPTDYEIQLKGTEGKYKEVKAEAERVIALYKDGGTTPNNYDKAVYGLQQITAMYEHHKDQLAYTRLYAPFDGYIQKKIFQPHETVGAGMPIVSMMGAGSPEVEINLPAADYIRREQFSHYSCTFDIYPAKVYALSRVSLTRKANANQLYTMRLKLEKTDMPMPTPGMNTMVSIYYNDQADQSLRVPASALLREGDQTYVYIYRKSSRKVERCAVEIVHLMSNGQTVVNSKELTLDDEVVSAGVHHIKDGETVKLVDTITKTNIGGLL